MAIGFLAGYVAGAAAGRERYEQIKKTARQVAGSPPVQKAVGGAQQGASSLYDAAKHKMGSRVNGRSLDDLDLAEEWPYESGESSKGHDPWAATSSRPAAASDAPSSSRTSTTATVSEDGHAKPKQSKPASKPKTES